MKYEIKVADNLISSILRSKCYYSYDLKVGDKIYADEYKILSSVLNKSYIDNFIVPCDEYVAPYNKTRAKIEIMQHFLEGGEIEWKLKADPKEIWSQWKSSYGDPTWDWIKYDYRIKETPKFRIPTKEEFENLIGHFSRWNKEKNGLEIMNEHGDILFFPAVGYKRNTCWDPDSCGCYWSSTITKFNSNCSYYLEFDTYSMGIYYSNFDCMYSIRLVSDKPFDGGIEFNGLWWKQENEKNYCNFDIAIEKFNK